MLICNENLHLNIESKNMKVKHKKVTPELLKSKISKEYGKAKWIIFCEILLQEGYTLFLYEATKTFSKYITVCKKGKCFKVRFSNHKPAFEKENSNDSDFYVGVTNFGITTYEDALRAVKKYFNLPKITIKK